MRLSIIAFSLILAAALFGSPAQAQTIHPVYAGASDSPNIVVLFWNPGYEKAQELLPVIRQIAGAIDETGDSRLVIHGVGRTLGRNYLMFALAYFYETGGLAQAWQYLEDVTAAGDQAIADYENWVETWAKKNGLFVDNLSKAVLIRSNLVKVKVERLKSACGIKKVESDTPAVIINNAVKLTGEEITLEAVLKALKETKPDDRLP